MKQKGLYTSVEFHKTMCILNQVNCVSVVNNIGV